MPAGLGTLALGAFGKGGASSILGIASAAMPWVSIGLTAAQLLAPLMGRGRKQANIFTSGVQTPISNRLKDIYTSANTQIQAGTLTYDEAQQALASFDTQAGEFETAAQQFEALGSKQKTVVEQGRATVKPTYTGWRSDLAQYVEWLKPAATPEPPKPPEAPPTIDNVPAKAQGAADQQRKRATSAYGRSSTILTGGGLAPLLKEQRRTATILGY